MRTRAGFTLTEIAFSLLILAVAVLATVAILPIGLKAQQQSRFQMYAAAKAQELIDHFVQHQIDFKERQDLVFRGAVAGADKGIDEDDQGTVDSGGRVLEPLPRHKAFEGRPLTGAAGQFDLERIVTNHWAGNYPLPMAIARRLDSPGNEIQRLLDAGALLYYSDPFSLGRFSAEGGGNAERGGAERGQVNEMQRLVWAVVGSPQNNALPMHPVVVPPREIYPFPPRTRSTIVPFSYSGDRELEAVKSGPPRTPGTFDGYPIGDQPVQDYSYRDRGPANVSGGERNPTSLYQNNNWEWFARGDRVKGRDAVSSRWLAGLHEFRRLSIFHWQRINHQLSLNGGRATVTLPTPFVKDRKEFERKATRRREIKEVQPDGTVTIREEFEERTEKRSFPRDTAGNIITPDPPGGSSQRGLPGLPVGRGIARLRGTDIASEDEEPWVKERDSQFRFGLPSLERRVMYRTAALALWARVAPKGPYQIMGIPAADLESPAAADIDADPNLATLLSALPAAHNPLLDVIEPPNPAEIHPTQVLALSYLAHAALMVTGYKPPFVDDRGTVTAVDDINLVEDETMPFKAVDAEVEHYLLNPFHPAAGQKRDLERRPLAQGEVDETEPRVGVKLIDDEANDLDESKPTFAKYQRTFDKKPIKYRRMLGAIRNPFPPPYADRGAFAMDGRATYTITEDRSSGTVDVEEGVPAVDAAPDRPAQPGRVARVPRRTMLRRVTGYAGPLGEDTRWARNAHETCLRWAMAYLSENPHDCVVPRPFNRQTMLDQPLYQLAFFDSNGRARRQPARDQSFPITFASDRALFGVGAAWPRLADNESAYARLKADRREAVTGTAPLLPPGREGRHFAWGRPAPDVDDGSGLWGDDAKQGQGFLRHSFGHQQRFQAFLNVLHGHLAAPIGAGGPTWNDTMADLSEPGAAVKDQFTLNRAFSPAERTRQLVFWAVDWKQYEDAESAPSAPVDLGQLGRNRNGDGTGISLTSLFGNPESAFTWVTPLREGTEISKPRGDVKKIEKTGQVRDARFRAIVYSNDGLLRMPPFAALGAWGADRNGNGSFDTGPVPRSVRMKASEVARFNFYDPVGWLNLRH